MNNTVSSVIRDLLYEDDMMSLTRLLSFVGYLAFIVASAYLMLKNIHWPDYGTFAGYTGGGAAALQFGNKFVNSKFNSIPGGYDSNKGS